MKTTSLEPRATSDGALSGGRVCRNRFHKLVAQPSTVALTIMLADALLERVRKMPLAERDLNEGGPRHTEVLRSIVLHHPACLTGLAPGTVSLDRMLRGDNNHEIP